MLEFMQIIFIIGLLAATCFVFVYMRYNTDYHEGLLHKIKNLLLYGYLKACITWETGKHYVDITLSSIFTGYHAGENHMKEIDRRQQQLMEVRDRMGASHDSYGRKSGYNLKILK